MVHSGKSGLDSKQESLLALLQRVANAQDQGHYEADLVKLQKCPVYTTHSNVQDYVENGWMFCVEQWAQAFR